MIRSQITDPKLGALLRSRSVNARASAVRGPLFSDSGFFDPHDLIQVRYEMVRRVCIEQHSISETSRLFGVSRPTFYKIKDDFDRSGLFGLLPIKRGPRGPHKLTNEVLKFIKESTNDDQNPDPTALVAAISKRFGVTVHRRTVVRALTPSLKDTTCPAALGGDSRSLTASYEALRAHELGMADCCHPLRGLALFMREGMAAWMMNVAEKPSRDSVVAPATSRTIPIPEGIERTLINIMANMALGVARGSTA